MTARAQRHVRFALAHLESLEGDRYAAHVELQGASTVYTGRAEGGAGDGGGLLGAARATAEALSQLGHPVALQDVALITVLGDPMVVARVTARYEGETRHLIGFSLARDDAMRAAALAVLDATNRNLETG